MKVRWRQTKSDKAGRAIVADIILTRMLRFQDGNKCKKNVENPYKSCWKYQYKTAKLKNFIIIASLLFKQTKER
jgi:hypothetical protein